MGAQNAVLPVIKLFGNVTCESNRNGESTLFLIGPFTGWREGLSDLEVTVKQGVGVMVTGCISVEEDAPGHPL